MKKYARLIKAAVILLIVFTNIGCDQVSKHIVRERVSYNQDINFLHGFFTLTKVENPGAFLSVGEALSGTRRFIVLVLLPVIGLLAGLIILIIKPNMNRILVIASCFMIGGGIGNIYDRVIRGSVTDFMHLGAGTLQTGIFNMADVSVTTGFILLLYYYWVTYKKDKLVTDS